VPAVRVRGYRELAIAFSQAEREVRRDFPRELREAATPIKEDAERLAGTKIRRIGSKWDKMRIGVTRTRVYVVPRQRGVRNKTSPRARPKFSELMLERAMRPALEQNEAEIEHRVEKALEHLCNEFNRGGITP